MTDKLCEVKDCTKPAKATTYCYMHYKRLRRHGDPSKAMTFKERSKIAVEARRLKKLERLEYERLESEPK
jgi:hypothetical protein